MTELPCGFSQGYGMTEMCPHVVAARRRRTTSSAIAGDADASGGSPAPARRASVSTSRSVATTARVCDVGEVGEITVRGPNMMPGYWNRPDETAKVFTADGWYRTGDLASVDEGGYLFIVDRAKDMIVSGGENVYTTEVENALASHPAVLELAVFGVPHEQWGEAVHAEVVLQARRHGDRAGADRPLPAVDRRVQGAADDRDPRRAAAEVGRRQDPEARHPRPVLGGPRPRACREPVDVRQTGDVKELLDDLDRWLPAGKRVAVARVVDIEGSGPRDPGAAMAVSADGEVVGSVSGGCVEGAVVTEALAVLAGERPPGIVTFGYSDDDAFAVGLTCGGTIRLFIEELDW